MIRFSDFIKMMDMFAYVCVHVMKEQHTNTLYTGELGDMSLEAYMQIKDMPVYNIESASVEEEEGCYTAFLNIIVKEVEGEE